MRVVLLLVLPLGLFACEQAPSPAPVQPVHPAPAPAARPPAPVTVAPPPPPVTLPLPDDADIREAALRYMIGHNASGQQQHAHVYCIGLLDADPPDAFLARLHDIHPVVKALSACTADASSGVTDKATHQHGLVFHADEIRHIDADHAELDGGYYEGGLSASGNTYYLERTHGTWVVTKDVMHWIS